MRVLGIETSCDDTAVAVVENGVNILSNVVSSQEAHKQFGGIVPELASRHHLELLDLVADRALDQAGVSLRDVDVIAVTSQHGLAGSLIAGVAFAKSLAAATGIPLLAVNHIEGHIYSPAMEQPERIRYPHVCLTVSGGHTLLAIVGGPCDAVTVIGNTLDDAGGEAFDKVAKALDLGFPGGPVIDRLASTRSSSTFQFSRPMKGSKDYNFSFSGLKTQVVNELARVKNEGRELDVADVARGFQDAVVDVLCEKTLHAAQEYNCSLVTIAGGVSANSQLRAEITAKAAKLGKDVIYPRLSLCTDNAAMIAGVAYHKFVKGDRTTATVGVNAGALL